MRRRMVVAALALTAAVALAGLPAPAGSRQPAEIGGLAPAAFTSVIVPADVPAPTGRDASGAASIRPVAAGIAAPFVDAGLARPSRSRPVVDLPEATGGRAWKEPQQVLHGYASFYDNGTTAMRLPRGTIVRICGAGGCIERTITDYGPVDRNGRIVDLYRPDFFRICGCGSWSGTTEVTVSVY